MSQEKIEKETLEEEDFGPAYLGQGDTDSLCIDDFCHINDYMAARAAE